jgi:hypothetical protein
MSSCQHVTDRRVPAEDAICTAEKELHCLAKRNVIRMPSSLLEARVISDRAVSTNDDSCVAAVDNM